MKSLLLAFITLVFFTTTAHGKKFAITACNSEIATRFNSNVKLTFPTPIVTENNSAVFIHYKNNHKITSQYGDSLVIKIDARCTFNKKTHKIVYVNISGKDRTK